MWSAWRPTVSRRCATFSSRSRRVLASLWMMRASPTIEPTVIRGFSDAYGSWKMICRSRRRARSDRLSLVVTFFPSNHTSPAVGSIRRRMHRPVVDLPQPDSPTSPSVSPALISKEMPSTACTRATSREKRPPLIGKCLTRFRTLRSGSAIVSLSLLVQPARHLVARFDFLERRLLLRVHRLDELAPRREPAALREVQQARDDAGDRLEALLVRGRGVDSGNRPEEPLRVRVERLLEELL